MGNEQKFKNKYRTQSHRLRNYDYSAAGGYFITICCQDKECLFGDVVEGQMVLNDIGKSVKECWCEITDHFPDVELDEFVIMPNHLHGIIFLHPSVETKNFLSLHIPLKYGTRRTIGSVIRGFKIGVTKYARKKTNMFTKIWQPNYYDHVIRNEQELHRIRKYIRQNTAKWNDDRDDSENIFI